MTIPIIVIAGPTAVGKTDVSIQIAKEIQGEIINGDSLQFYKGLDIGTGKIQESEKEGVPHHLLDFLKPEQSFDVSQFVVKASAAIEDIRSRERYPIIVGGSGLYIEGLLYEMSFGHENSHNADIREQLNRWHQELGNLAIWQHLNEKDPDAAAKIPYQNHRRVIRALEVIEVTGKKFSSQQEQNRQKNRKSRYNGTTFILNRPREILYNRINKRVELMIECGLESEVYALYQKYKGQDLQSLKAIGYKEWFPYFEGSISKEMVISTIQQNSRRYAKRQLTWFRNRLEHTHWIDATKEPLVLTKMLDIMNDSHD